MSAHLRVAELNDLVKPDEQDTVLRRLFRAAPNGVAGTDRVASVQARSCGWHSSAGNNVTAI